MWGTDDAAEQRRRNHTPQLSKEITSELGNVSPWILVPGVYSPRQLSFQAHNIAASVTNNASFNCVATKVLVTWRQWPGRQRFLELLGQTLANTPRRQAYYPGAHDRFVRFSGQQLPDTDDGTLPWTLLTDVDPRESTHLLREESFVCVLAEVALDATSPESFLNRAVDFVNDQLFGTLAAALTFPAHFRQGANQQLVADCLDRLRYGTIGINHWPGLAFVMMSPPWGGYPGATLQDPESGIGWVHNTFRLRACEKTILSGPLTVAPRPVWFANHRRADAVGKSLFRLYCDPRPTHLLPVLASALRA